MQVIESTFDEKKDELLRVNQSQLYEGFDQGGKRLKKYKNVRYAGKKNKMNVLPGFGNPDFFVTGEFYSNWKIERAGQKIITELGDNGKADFLIKRDPEIIGLGGEYRKGFVENTLQPAYLSKMHEQLKL